MAKSKLTNEEQLFRKRVKNKKWRTTHREQINKKNRERYAANPELARKRNKIARIKWIAKNPPGHASKRTTKWQKANPERFKEITAKYRATHKEQIKINGKIRRSQNPDQYKNYILKTKHKITFANYTALLAAQNGCCAICSVNNPGHKCKYWCVDHCHKTNIIRGLLCHSCNNGLGRFKDNITLLQRAIDYLKKFS